MSVVESPIFVPYQPVDVSPVATPLQPLQTEGHLIYENGAPIHLQGVCVPRDNWEGFIFKFPGVQQELKRTFAYELGEDAAQAFDEGTRTNYFTEEDARFYASLGFNTVRWALNIADFIDYRHPEAFNTDAFKKLEEHITVLANYGIRTVLDGHAMGYQNPDWHSDNNTDRAMFWDVRYFQDEAVRFWAEAATYFKDNPAIAAFDLINEPNTKTLKRDYDYDALNGFYERAVTEIRKVDPNRICILEGDAFAAKVKDKDGRVRLLEPFTDNLIYSSHPYYTGAVGLGAYPGYIDGQEWNAEAYYDWQKKQQFFTFVRERNVPHFLGEYGLQICVPEEIPDRLKGLDDQLAGFARYEQEFGIPLHRTIWNSGDDGTMGLKAPRHDSPYSQRVATTEQIKESLKLDWIKMKSLPPNELEKRIREIAEIVAPVIGFDTNEVEGGIKHKVLPTYLADALQLRFVHQFSGMTPPEIYDMLKNSWDIRECVINAELVTRMRTDTGVHDIFIAGMHSSSPEEISEAKNDD